MAARRPSSATYARRPSSMYGEGARARPASALAAQSLDVTSTGFGRPELPGFEGRVATAWNFAGQTTYSLDGMSNASSTVRRNTLLGMRQDDVLCRWDALCTQNYSQVSSIDKTKALEQMIDVGRYFQSEISHKESAIHNLEEQLEMQKQEVDQLHARLARQGRVLHQHQQMKHVPARSDVAALKESIAAIENDIRRFDINTSRSMDRALDRPVPADSTGAQMQQLLELKFQRLETLMMVLKKRVLKLEENEGLSSVVSRFGTVRDLLAENAKLTKENAYLRLREEKFETDALLARRDLDKASKSSLKILVMALQNELHRARRVIADNNLADNAHLKHLIAPPTPLPDVRTLEELTKAAQDLAPVVPNDELMEAMNSFRVQVGTEKPQSPIDTHALAQQYKHEVDLLKQRIARLEQLLHHASNGTVDAALVSGTTGEGGRPRSASNPLGSSLASSTSRSKWTAAARRVAPRPLTAAAMRPSSGLGLRSLRHDGAKTAADVRKELAAVMVEMEAEIKSKDETLHQQQQLLHAAGAARVDAQAQSTQLSAALTRAVHRLGQTQRQLRQEQVFARAMFMSATALAEVQLANEHKLYHQGSAVVHALYADVAREYTRRINAAVRIQAWWRGSKSRSRAYSAMKVRWTPTLAAACNTLIDAAAAYRVAQLPEMELRVRSALGAIGRGMLQQLQPNQQHQMQVLMANAKWTMRQHLSKEVQPLVQREVATMAAELSGDLNKLLTGVQSYAVRPRRTTFTQTYVRRLRHVWTDPEQGVGTEATHLDSLRGLPKRRPSSHATAHANDNSDMISVSSSRSRARESKLARSSSRMSMNRSNSKMGRMASSRRLGAAPRPGSSSANLRKRLAAPASLREH